MADDMTKREALAILKQLNDSFAYVQFYKNDITVRLDGEYTAEQLLAVVWRLRNPGQTEA
jgi:hypothetical protein